MITARHLVDAIDLQNRLVEEYRGKGEDIGAVIAAELGVESKALYATLQVLLRELDRQYGEEPSQLRELAGMLAAFQIGIIAAREERDGVREG